ncbi:MAG: ABC transporter permease subunit [Mariprofundaceae bacterium]|nr:ABC transporter permease subunit [Mariprofundaceae bacterium]
MNPILTLVWKEWRCATDTPLAYVVAAAFLLASGFFFGNSLFLIGQAEMRGYFSWLPILFMFFIPALCMRLLADEQRLGTFELLCTLPVQTSQVVLGKFFGIWLQLSLLLLLTFFYPLTLSLIGDIDVGQIGVSYLAAWLLAGSYAAICLFASSLTKNAVVAYMIGFGCLLLIFLMGQILMQFSASVQNTMAMFSPIQHYQAMLRGILGLDNLVCMLAMILVFLSATTFQLERRRWK